MQVFFGYCIILVHGAIIKDNFKNITIRFSAKKTITAAAADNNFSKEKISLNSFMGKIYRFMQGRYGFDSLGSFLFLAGFIMGVLCMFLRFVPTAIPYYICSFLNTFFYIFGVYRVLSRNIQKRTLENERFLTLRDKLIPSYEEKSKSIRDRNYIYKKCPKCSSKYA